MTHSRLQRFGVVLLILAMCSALAFALQGTGTHPVSAQSSTTTPGTMVATTPLGTGAATPGITTTPVSTAGSFLVCGPVSAFTAATATAAGSIAIGGVTFPIAAGTTFVGTTIATGSTFCAQVSANGSGQLLSGNITGTAAPGSTINVCGPVTSFTAATATGTGTLTIGALTLTLGAGMSFTGSTLSVGSTVCVQATLTATGQVSAGTVAVPLSATPVYAGRSYRATRSSMWPS